MDSSVIGFSENHLRFIKINSAGVTVISGETELGFSIGEHSYLKKNMQDILNIFSLKLGEFIKPDEIAGMNAGVIVDTSQAFINTVPVDFNENESRIKSHLLWELSNFFPDSYKDYSMRYLKLKSCDTGSNIFRVLVIAMDKNRMNFIRTLCNGIGVRIRNLEIDHLAVEKFAKSVLNNQEKSFMIAGFKDSRMDISIILKDKIIFYDYGRAGKQNYQNVLFKFLNSLNSSTGYEYPERIFLYGERIDGELIKIVSDELGSDNVSVLSPLIDSDQQRNASTYAPLYGLALKNLS